ncbi:YaiI/YqxD family protein [Dellaglioa sp. L3N]
MKIMIDGDASPVKNEVISEAEHRKLSVLLITSTPHFSTKEYPENVSVSYVDQGPDAADYRIVKLAEKSDIVITQDYGLASLLFPKGVIVMHHRGFEYTNYNIDGLLESRYMSAMARKSGQRTKGPSAFSNQDRANFKEKFNLLLNEKGY